MSVLDVVFWGLAPGPANFHVWRTVSGSRFCHERMVKVSTYLYNSVVLRSMTSLSTDYPVALRAAKQHKLVLWQTRCYFN